ncbi:MAG TPA: YceI family protein [Chitinophagaceae bacterium]|nr:YceI family protein [Chitinophagaceae bacterium]
MKKTILFVSFVIAAGSLFAQKKITTSATVKFDASTAIDNLPKAENKTAIGSINTTTGELAFEAAVKNFAFSNPRIQEHFNGSNWLDSDKHPTFTYKGNVTDITAVNFTKEGTYEVNTEGVLTVKGVEQKLTAPATITVKGASIIASADFSIKLSDFGITGAPIDGGKVAKEPKINISAELK